MFVNDFLKLNKFTYFGVLSVVSQKGLSGQKQGLAGGAGLGMESLETPVFSS